MMLVELSCLRPTTQLHCPLKEYKTLGKTLQLYSHVVTARRPFKLSTSLILAIWPQGVLWLWSHYGVMLVELSCVRPTTQLHCPLKEYKTVRKPL